MYINDLFNVSKKTFVNYQLNRELAFLIRGFRGSARGEVRMKTNRISWIVVCSICFIITITALSAEEQSPLNRFMPEQQEKLLAGEAIFEYVSCDDSGGKDLGHGRAYAIINKPIDECCRNMTDIENKYVM
jgi:hypothetical protein